MGDDYGYFGKDDEGYAHYTDASGESGDEERQTGGTKRIGCGTVVLIVIVIVAFLSKVAGCIQG